MDLTYAIISQDSPPPASDDVPAVVQKKAKAPKKPRKAPAKPRKAPAKPRKAPAKPRKRKTIPWEDQPYKCYIKSPKASPVRVNRAERFMMEEEQRDKDADAAMAAMAAARVGPRQAVDYPSSDDDDRMSE